MQSLNLIVTYIIFEEHVLRNCSSTSAIKRDDQPFRSTLEPPTASETTTNNREPVTKDRSLWAQTKSKHSPTPSMKRGKAEKLLKEHGSPPGMRVTAGGRVVPTDLAPLGSPKYSQNEFKRSALKAYPLAKAPLNVQFRNSNVFPAPYALYNHSFQPELAAEGDIPRMPFTYGFDFGEEPNAPQIRSDDYSPWSVNWQLPEPSVEFTGYNFYPSNFSSHTHNKKHPVANMRSSNSELLKKQKDFEQRYAKMDHELKEFEKQEVLKQDTMTDIERQKTVQKKKQMIIELDKIRKAVKEMQNQLETANNTLDNRVWSHPLGNSTQPAYSHAVVPTPMSGQMATMMMDGKNGISSSQIHPGYSQGSLSFTHPEYDSSFANSMQMILSTQNISNSEQSYLACRQHVEPSVLDNNEFGLDHVRGDNGTVARNSHAVPIRDPKNVTAAIPGKKTSLNPTSPIYEPTHLVTLHQDTDVHSPTRPPKITAEDKLTMHHQQRNESSGPVDQFLGERTKGRVSSLSSVATADFFPKDTAEHSSATYDFSQPIVGTANEFLRNPVNAWNIEVSRKEQGCHHQPLVPKSIDKFGPIAPPVSPADIRSQRSATGSFDCFSKGMSDVHPGRTILSRLPEDILLGALTKYQSDKERDIRPARIDVEGRSTTFVEGLYAGLLHGTVPPFTDSDFDKGYCIGLLNSRKNTVVSARTNSSEESRQSSSLSLKFDNLPYVGTQHNVHIDHNRYSSSNFNYAIGLHRSYEPVERCQNELSNTADSGNPASTISNNYLSHKLPAETNKALELPNAWSIIRKEPSGAIPSAQATPSHYYSENAVPAHQNGLNGRQSSSFASRVRAYPPHATFGCNQSSKSRISIAPSKNQANGSFQQFDGAVGELKDLNNNNSNGSSPSTPARRLPHLKRDNSQGHTKEVQREVSPRSVKEAPKSPARSHSSRKTSVSPAKAKIGNITAMIKNSMKPGEERLDELNGPGNHGGKDKTRRKENWRENWRKRFQEIKSKEREEIEKYKRDNPIE